MPLPTAEAARAAARQFSPEAEIAQGKADFECIALLGIAVGYEVAPPGQPQLKAIVLISDTEPGAEWLESPDGRLGANGVFSLDRCTPLAYTLAVARRFITVAETPLFSRQAREVWDDSELSAFIDFIARNPEEGDLIPETAVCERSDGRGPEAVNAAARG